MEKEEKKANKKDREILENIENFIWNPVKQKEPKK